MRQFSCVTEIRHTVDTQAYLHSRHIYTGISTQAYSLEETQVGVGVSHQTNWKEDHDLSEVGPSYSVDSSHQTGFDHKSQCSQ